MKQKLNTTQLLRHGIQIAAFILFPGLFLTAFNAIRDIASALIGGTFTWAAMAEPVMILGILLLVTILWGRFFCGYLCAFGAIQDLMAILSRIAAPRLKKVPRKADRILKFGKYVVLFGVILFLWVLQLPVDSSYSPWGVFGMLVSWNGTVMSAAIPTVGFGILLAILIASFFIERFFCRYLCPLGAVFTLTSGKRLFRIRRAEEQCTGCGACTRNCAMGINVHEKSAVSSGECIDCMQCTTACYPEALSANPNPAVTGTATALLMGGLITVGNLAASRISATDDTTITATVDTVGETVHENKPTAGNEQTKKAWKSESSGQEKRSKHRKGSDESVTRPAVNTENNIENNTEANTENNIKDNTEANTNETTVESPAGNSGLQDGVYTGSGTGFRGTTEAQVTVSGGQITDITILSYRDDNQFFNKAKSTIINEVLQAQSVDVSTVSGATYSSKGILEAVANAVGFEYTNTSSGSGKRH